jgi:hypothetical protein
MAPNGRRETWLADPEERYALRVFSRVSGLLHINTSVVKPGELASAKIFSTSGVKKFPLTTPQLREAEQHGSEDLCPVR